MNKHWLTPLFGLLLLACQNDDFDPVSKLNSARILATKVTPPYAKPGETVSVEMLATDARPDAPADEMQRLWLTTVCENPIYDLYYACYLNFATTYQPGVPLKVGDPLVKDARDPYEVPIAADLISRHPRTEGLAPYGTAFVFSMVCAGDHVEYLGLRTKPSPQSPPFGCFDADGKQLGADSFVFAFTRIYAFEDRTNENPKIEAVRFGGETIAPVDLTNCGAEGQDKCKPLPSTLPITLCDKKIGDCPIIKVDTIVPQSSQEADRTSQNGKEQLWVDYYSNVGKFEDDVRVLYDAAQGRVSDTAVEYRTPNKAVENPTLWAVVHDNRGGVDWLELKLNIP